MKIIIWAEIWIFSKNSSVAHRGGAKFSYVDVLENNDVRTTLPDVSDWPTFPQVCKGELIGGLILSLRCMKQVS